MQLPGVGWGSLTFSGCAGRSDIGVRKAQPVAEALGRCALSFGGFEEESSSFLKYSRCVDALWEKPGEA